ncbi:NAD(P)/FAD-dependent oxidoreductase [Actinoplanes sp. NPDC049265]|uniref:NAD(P)/FAD-dependent oxidoreductase n=1 Tax=Actinoplanes sp. NPDC049265 TaxID=3363902 RepID=UPI0037239E77
MTRRLVVAGYGMVAHRLVDRLRRLDRDGRWSVVVLGEEDCPAYDRVALSSYLDGKSRADLTLPPPGPPDAPPVDLRLGCPAVAVDTGARLVRTAAGDVLRYDALVLATGARPFVPPVPGHDRPGCFVYRTFDDIDEIRGYAVRGRPAVVVGGGLLGLEAANGLKLLGRPTTVVENAPHLMPAQLDAEAARVLRALASDAGLRVRCPASLTSVEAGADGGVAGVRLAGGELLPAGLVVFAAGVRPRDELAAAAAPGGLARGDRGGFLVDAHCRTSAPDVWAAGDCAAVEGRCHGLVAAGFRMADSVARQLTGRPAEPFDGTGAAVNLKVAGIRVTTAGVGHPGTMASEITFTDGGDRYAKVVLTPETGEILGGALVGGAAPAGTLRAMVGRVAPPDLEQLLLPTDAGPPRRWDQDRRGDAAM